MVSAIVSKTRPISIQDLLNVEDDIEHTVSKTDDGSIESIIMAEADTTSLKDPTRSTISHDRDVKEVCVCSIEEQLASVVRV